MRTRSKKILIVLSVIVFVLFGFWVFAIYTIRSENRETNMLLEQAEEEVRKEGVAQYIKNLRNINSQEIEDFEATILTDNSIISVIESIESSGRALGLAVEIATVEKLPSENENEPQKIRIVVETDGAWNSSFSFLRAIESLPHRVLFEDVSFSKQGTDWHSRVEILLYSFK